MGSFPETYNDPVKVKLLILREPCTSTGSEFFSSFIMLWHHQICMAKVLYSYRDALPKRLFKITARVCIKSTSGWRVETDSALILPPSLHQYSVIRVFKLLKATRKGKKSKQGFELTLRNRSRDLHHREGRSLTDCALSLFHVRSFITTFYFRYLIWPMYLLGCSQIMCAH